MVIVTKNALSLHEGKTLYQEDFFSGVGLDFLNGVAVSKDLYDQGRVIGEYKNPYFPQADGALCIKASQLDDEFEEPCTYNGEVFSGIAYFFEGDQCLSEKQYQYGWLLSEVSYLNDGSLFKLEVIDEGLSQKYSWYPNSEIERFEVFEREAFGISLVFSKCGEISGLSIDGDYFDRVEFLRDKLKVHRFDNKNFPEELSGADYLYVSGSCVGKDVFNSLLFNNGLDSTSKLRICRTQLDIESINELAKLNRLGELYIESEVLSLDDIIGFKLLKPDCYVEFNRKEVG